MLSWMFKFGNRSLKQFRFYRPAASFRSSILPLRLTPIFKPSISLYLSISPSLPTSISFSLSPPLPLFFPYLFVWLSFSLHFLRLPSSSFPSHSTSLISSVFSLSFNIIANPKPIEYTRYSSLNTFASQIREISIRWWNSSNATWNGSHTHAQKSNIQTHGWIDFVS